MASVNVLPVKANPEFSLTLGGELTHRDKMEANKYKISGLGRGLLKKKPRPKSTPSGEMVRDLGLMAPKSAPPGSAGSQRTRCTRYYEDVVGRKNMLEVTLPTRKNKPRLPSAEREADHLSIKDYNLGPGITMSKTKGHVAVKINAARSITPLSRLSSRGSWPGSRHSGMDDERDQLIEQLQQQIADLSMFLEEERVNHRLTKEKGEYELKLKMDELSELHQHHLGELEEDHQAAIEELKEEHKKKLLQEKAAADSEQSRLKGELDFLQGAFEAYKVSVAQDMEEKWAKKKSDIRLKHQEEMDRALAEQRSQLIQERSKEKKMANRELQRQIAALNSEHKKEMDAMMKRFASAAHDVENLKKTLDQLKSVEEQLQTTKSELSTARMELTVAKQQLADAQLKITGYEEHFQEKIEEVDEKYKQKMQHLMNENTDLRKRYIAKCDELFNEKSNTESRRVENFMTAKQTMQMLIHVRNRAEVSMAAADINLDPEQKVTKLRPSSAPITTLEARQAQLSAGETQYITNPPVVPDNTTRPYFIASAANP